MSSIDSYSYLTPPNEEINRTVTSNNTFGLPRKLIAEIGYKSKEDELSNGAKVGWYYDDKDEKAVLSDRKASESSLEHIGTSQLSGVDNDDLSSYHELRGVNITIINELPDEVYENLINSDEVVLKPIYKSNHDSITSTQISVYPAELYYEGELPNVTTETKEINQEDETTIELQIHANSAKQI